MRVTHPYNWKTYNISMSSLCPNPVFHLGFRRGMAPPILLGTLSCPPGTQLTRLGITNTHPSQLRVQTESVEVCRHRQLLPPCTQAMLKMAG